MHSRVCMCVCMYVCVCVYKTFFNLANKGSDLPQTVATDFFLKITSASTEYSLSHCTSPDSEVSASPNYSPFVATLTTCFNGLRASSQCNPLPDHLADLTATRQRLPVVDFIQPGIISAQSPVLYGALVESLTLE